MSIQQGLALVSSSYAMRRDICEYADSLEFISLNHVFRRGFHYYGGDLQYIWMSIISNRANQIAFYVISVQRSIMQAIAEIEDEWTVKVEYDAW